MLRIILNDLINEMIDNYSRRSKFPSLIHSRLRYFFSKVSIGKSPIIIYQMGKVGSQSIVQSLRDLELDTLIYHMHWMTEKGAEIWKNELKQELRPRNIEWQKYIGKKLRLERFNDERWKLISLTRDPVARNLSCFFYHIIHKSNLDYTKKYEKGLIELKDFERWFIESYPHHIPLKWFDYEMNKVTGLDIYKREFPKSKGFLKFRDNNLDLLIIRLEDLNRVGEKAINDFLNINCFELMKSNVAENKEYYSLYHQFKSNLKLSEDYLDKMYKSKYTEHFYSEKEIRHFRSKWSD